MFVRGGGGGGGELPNPYSAVLFCKYMSSACGIWVCFTIVVWRERERDDKTKSEMRRRPSTSILHTATETAEGVPQYKSLLNSQYMTSEVADKLDELNNIEPLPQLRKVRRINTIVPSKPPQPKRKQSVGTRKPLSPKARKINTRSLSPIRGD